MILIKKIQETIVTKKEREMIEFMIFLKFYYEQFKITLITLEGKFFIEPFWFELFANTKDNCDMEPKSKTPK